MSVWFAWVWCHECPAAANGCEAHAAVHDPLITSSSERGAVLAGEQCRFLRTAWEGWRSSRSAAGLAGSVVPRHAAVICAAACGRRRCCWAVPTGHPQSVACGCVPSKLPELRGARLLRLLPVPHAYNHRTTYCMPRVRVQLCRLRSCLSRVRCAGPCAPPTAASSRSCWRPSSAPPRLVMRDGAAETQCRQCLALALHAAMAAGG